MLRSIGVTCLRMACRIAPVNNVTLSAAVLPTRGMLKRSLHMTSSTCVMSRNIRSKQHVIDTAMQAKQAPVMEDEDQSTSYLEGLSIAGTTVPTLETMSALYDGVRFDELPIIHIKSSLNNTIMHVTNHSGQEFIARSSCGQEGFKNVKKSTNVAAQATGLSLGSKILQLGVRNVRVVVKGLGAGRLASIKGLQMAGINVVSITDDTHVPHNGPRPRKAKRL